MLMDVGLLLFGALMLYFGAEWLVRGAAGLALAFGVRPLVIGLTVTAYATSAPELFVSTLATWQGKSDIALGNVIGSNVANIGLILGLTTLISRPRTDGDLAKREMLILCVATLVVPALLLDGLIGRLDAILLLLGSMGFTWAAIRWSRRQGAQEALEPEAGRSLNRAKLCLLLLIGLALLLFGGQLFVKGAVRLALQLGLSERVVGLTIVALGTSLPELFASLVAAFRGHSELAIGNVVGSNVFNLLLVLGAAGLVLPVYGSLANFKIDLMVMAGLTLFCLYVLRKARRLSRPEGAAMLVVYVSFLVHGLI